MYFTLSDGFTWDVLKTLEILETNSWNIFSSCCGDTVCSCIQFTHYKKWIELCMACWVPSHPLTWKLSTHWFYSSPLKIVFMTRFMDSSIVCPLFCRIREKFCRKAWFFSSLWKLMFTLHSANAICLYVQAPHYFLSRHAMPANSLNVISRNAWGKWGNRFIKDEVHIKNERKDVKLSICKC